MKAKYTGTFSPWLKTYDDVKILYESLHHTEEITGRPLPPETWDDARHSARVVYRRPFSDPLASSLRQDWRHAIDRDGESGTDYIILPDDPADPWTDEEIAHYLYESPVYSGRPRHEWDCTGERFTWGWSYTRTPAGIALIHKWSIDV